MEQLPEQSVVAAMVSRAVLDATAPPVTNLKNKKGEIAFYHVYKRDMIERERDLAMQWVNSESVEPMSFQWCCDILEINADYIRWSIESRPRAIYTAMKREQANMQRGPKATADEV